MQDNKLRFCEWVIEFLVLAALLAAPLFIDPYSAQPFEESKAPFIRALAMIGLPFLVMYLALRSNDPEKNPLYKRPLVLLVLAVAYVAVTATVFSLSPQGSFFGLFHRRQGSYTTLAYIFFFLAVSFTADSRSRVERILSAFQVVGFAVAYWAIMQYLGLDPNPKASAARNWQVWATLGNPIFLAAVLVMVVPVNLYFLVRSLSRILELGLAKARVEAVFMAMTVIFLGANLTIVYLAVKRGPFLGLLAGLFFFGVLYALYKNKTKLTAGLLAAGFALALVLAIVNLTSTSESLQGRTGFIKRLSFSFETQTGQVRMHIWEGILNLMSSYPPRLLTGYGQETLPLALAAHRSPTLQYIENPEARADRSHNEMFDRLAMQGLLGLGVYICFMGALIRLLFLKLGLIASKPENRAFIICFILGGLFGWLFPPLALAKPTLSGMGLGLGLTAGVSGFLLYRTIKILTGRPVTFSPDAPLVICLFSAIMTHFVEVQTSFEITATSLHFWLLAGLAAAEWKPAGPTEALESPAPPSGGVFTAANTSPAFICGLAGTIIVFDFIWMASIREQMYLGLAGFGIFLSVICVLNILYLNKQEGNRGGEYSLALRGLSLGLGLICLYLISSYWLELPMTRWIGPLIGQYIPNVLNKMVKVSALYFWTWAFVIIAALVVYASFFKGRILKSTLRIIWIAPLFLALSLPFAAMPNLTVPWADIYTKAGDELGRKKSFQRASFCLKKAVDLEPSLAIRYQKLGLVYFQWAKSLPKGDKAKDKERDRFFQEAMFNVDKAHHIDPLDPQLSNNLARISAHWASAVGDKKLRLHRLNLADRYYGRAIKIDPRNTRLWKESAGIAFQLGRPDLAIKRNQEALKLHQGDFQAQASLANLYARDKKYAKALEHARAALKLAKPKNKAGLERMIADLEGRLK